MIHMLVAGLALDPRNSQPIVVLNDENKVRALPIWIGAPEARAISLALERVKTERPMTHELMLNAIEQLGYRVEQIDIDSMSTDTYFATIRLVPISTSREAGEPKSIDARPSDAIALALAADAPIFASAQVVESGAVTIISEEEQEKEMEFRKFVEEVKASDFNLAGLSINPELEDTAEASEEWSSGPEHNDEPEIEEPDDDLSA